MDAAIPEGHRKLKTGSSHVVLRLTPLKCEIPPAVPLLVRRESRKHLRYVPYFGASCARASESQ
jgi:hypothetical protein